MKNSLLVLVAVGCFISCKENTNYKYTSSDSIFVYDTIYMEREFKAGDPSFIIGIDSIIAKKVLRTDSAEEYLKLKKGNDELSISFTQKPKDGSYTYDIAFEEWGGKSLGASCLVKIVGDSIFIIHNGTGNLTGKKGDILDKGVILKHEKTGKWIIAHSPNDKFAKEIGGCTGGPAIIDFKQKKYWSC